jgi:hypothetical protein
MPPLSNLHAPLLLDGAQSQRPKTGVWFQFGVNNNDTATSMPG